MHVNIVDFESSLIENHSADAHMQTVPTKPSQVHAAVPRPSPCAHVGPSMHCMQLLPMALLLTAGEVQCQVCDLVVNATRTSSLMENKIQCNLTEV